MSAEGDDMVGDERPAGTPGVLPALLLVLLVVGAATWFVIRLTGPGGPRIAEAGEVAVLPTSTPAPTTLSTPPATTKATSAAPAETTTTTTTTVPMRTVPDVLGMDEIAAFTELRAAGFAVITVDYRESDTPGAVLETEPAAGASVRPGTEVTVVVGKPRPAPTVVVPDLTGLTVDEVEYLLRENGWTGVLTDTDKQTSDPSEHGRVIDQSIPADTEVAVDAPLAVQVGRLG